MRSCRLLGWGVVHHADDGPVAIHFGDDDGGTDVDPVSVRDDVHAPTVDLDETGRAKLRDGPSGLPDEVMLQVLARLDGYSA